jgi:DNA-directed RNA polymerase specialized sigma24 family protein
MMSRRVISQYRADTSRIPSIQSDNEDIQNSKINKYKPITDENPTPHGKETEIEFAKYVFGEAMKILRRPPHKFSEQQLQCFELNVIKNMDPSEICDRLNVTTQKVFNAKHRIMDSFKETCEAVLDAAANAKISTCVK